MVLVLCQLIKLVIVLIKDPKISFTKLIWEGFWVGKFPSTHSAIISSSFYLLTKYSPDKSVIAFALIISLLFIYRLLEDKKRQQITEEYLSKSKDTEIQKIVTERKLLDFSGHTFTEVIVGILIGIICTSILDLSILL